MNATWQWFLKNGDKLLAWATGVLAAAQTQGLMDEKTFNWVMLVMGSLIALHNTFLPEAKPASVPLVSIPTQEKSK